MRMVIMRSEGPMESKGILIVEEDACKLFDGVSLELPWLGNQHGISCIPKGIYDCEKCSTEKHPDSFLVKNVPNRTGIMIHILNFAAGEKVDTLGCIGAGLYFGDINDDGYTDICESTKAMKKLNKVLPNKFKLYII